MRQIDFYMVDAFATSTFEGNAAAVCPLTEWLPDETLLKMSKQHNQSETAYFVPTEKGFELRWFTTQAEINLCGHATLAAAHVIFEHLNHPGETIQFDTRFVGPLTVTRNGEWLTLDFPAWKTEPVTPPGEGEYDFVSRFFCPGEAVVEDPVTGSAHSMLIPYWAEKLNKTQMMAYQGAERGGDLRCQQVGERVHIGGQATTYLSGKILLR